MLEEGRNKIITTIRRRVKMMCQKHSFSHWLCRSCEAGGKRGRWEVGEGRSERMGGEWLGGEELPSKDIILCEVNHIGMY